MNTSKIANKLNEKLSDNACALLETWAGVGAKSVVVCYWGGDDSGNVTFEGVLDSNGEHVDLEKHEVVIDLARQARGIDTSYDKNGVAYDLVSAHLGYIPSAGDGYLFGAHLRIDLETGELETFDAWDEHDGDEVPNYAGW